MNILNAISMAITGHEKSDDSLLIAARDKPEKEVIALVRKAFKGNNSRPNTKEEINRPTDTTTNPEHKRRADTTLVSLTTTAIDINLQNDKGFTVLMYAAQRNLNDLARLLIDKGAKTSLQNGQKKTASTLTKNEELKAFLQELETEEIQREKDATISDAVERLRQAMLSGSLTAIEELVPQLPYPADCFKRRFFHEGDMVTLQDLVLRLGRGDVVESFVRAGGDVLAPDGRGRHALLRLVGRKRLPSWPHTELARQQEAERIQFMHLLLKSPSCKAVDQLQAMDHDGFSALLLAVEGGLDNVVEALLTHPAVASDKNKILVNARVVSRYPHRGPAAHRSKLGDTALVLAVRKKFHKVATLLVEQGQCEVDLSAQGGMTALHWAAFNGDQAMVRYLLCRRADVNARTDTGHTPLMLAVESRDLSTATLLLGFMHTWDAEGAMVGKEGMTDMERYIAEKKQKARKEKRSEPADPNIATDFGYTPLTSLCRLAYIPSAPALHTREGATSAAMLMHATASASASSSSSSVSGMNNPPSAVSASHEKALAAAAALAGASSTPVKATPAVPLRSPSKGKGRGDNRDLTSGPSSSSSPLHTDTRSSGTPGAAVVTTVGAAAGPAVSSSLRRSNMPQRPGQGPGPGDPLEPVALFDLVQLLLGRGASLDHKTGDGCTALMWAVHQNNRPLWHQLVTAGADIDVLDGNRQPITERVRDVVTKTEILAARHGNKAVRAGSPSKGTSTSTGTGNGETVTEDDLKKFTQAETFQVESVLVTWKDATSTSK